MGARNYSGRLIATWAVLSATMLPGTAPGQSAGVEPQAEKLLKAATAYVVVEP